MALGGMIGRIGQGMNLGSAPPIDAAKVAEAAAEVATGGKLAAAKTAMKAAAPAVGGFVQGAAVGAGYRASGIIGKIFGFFWDTIIANNNEYDLFIKIAAVMYLADFIHGFNPGIALAEHLIFAMVAFILIAERNANISRWNYIWVTIIFLSIWQVTLQGSAFVLRATSGAVLLAFALVMYLRSNVPMPLKGIPFIAAIDVLVLNVFRVPLLQYAENAGFVLKGVSYLMNRMLNPILLFYGLIYMKKESPVVAGRLFVIVFFIYLFAAATPILADTIKEYRAGATPLTSEEGQQAGNVITTSTRNFVNFITLKFVKPSVAYASEKAEETFGFGEAKEEPKMGLQLRDDPNMPKVFDLEIYDAAEPSAIMDVPNPLPLDSKKQSITVQGVECAGDSGKLDPGEPSEPASFPVTVTYKRPKTVKCEYGKVEDGSYSAKITVKYSFAADADMSTAFMRSDKLEALIGSSDPKAREQLSKIPPARAEYDNGPVAITWGPVELVTSPESVEITTESIDITTPRPKEAGLEIYISKSGSWEGEIAGISDLTLTVPDGITLKTDDTKCMFEGSAPDYKAKNKIILIKPEVGSEDISNLRFIGDGVQFRCKMNLMPDTLLHGADSAGVKFKVHVDYVFSTKKTVGFEVKGGKTGTTTTTPAPTQQQLQDKCKYTGGTWKTATATEAATCDCGTGKKWDVYPKGCIGA